MASRQEILEHCEHQKMLRSILEILQLYRAQSHNLNQGKCLKTNVIFIFPKLNLGKKTLMIFTKKQKFD